MGRQEGMVALLSLSFLICLTLGWYMAASDPEAAEKALQDAGYTAVTIRESILIGCGEGEVGWKASATNPRGVRVEVKACCGMIGKVCTIRH